MKKYRALSVVLMLLVANNILAQTKQHKIVFQFTNANDTLQQKAFVTQLENITTHWPEGQFQVVLYNHGVDLALPGSVIPIDRLKALHAKGVRFVVCENTLRRRKISKDAFDATVIGFVKSGIAEVVEKQEQDWSYIKGGF